MSEVLDRAGGKALRIAGEILPDDIAELAAGPMAEALSKAMSLAASSVSGRTERAYSDAWSHFSAWCEERRASYLPASPAVVGAYLAERSESVGKSSLRITLSALAYYHRRSGHLWSSSHPIIASVMKGILRKQRRAVRPAAALTSVEVRAMLDTCRDDLTGVRDRALLLIGLAGGLRRSELVAIDVEDIRFERDGLVLKIRHSKADQEGEGAHVGISNGSRPETCPVRAVQTWLRQSGIEYGPVFRSVDVHGGRGGRLTGGGVWWVIKSRAKLAGVAAPDGERLSPHGLRAGFISEAYLHGALDEQVMAHARQKSIETTRGYRKRAKVVQESPTKLLDL